MLPPVYQSQEKPPLVNIDARCGGVAPNTHVRCVFFGKPKLDAAEELGRRSMPSNQIQTSDMQPHMPPHACQHRSTYARKGLHRGAPTVDLCEGAD